MRQQLPTPERNTNLRRLRAGRVGVMVLASYQLLYGGPLAGFSITRGSPNHPGIGHIVCSGLRSTRPQAAQDRKAAA